MQIPSNILGHISPADFLRDYWQKKPLLIRQAIPEFDSPLSPDELAGLACEEEVESRLVLEKDGTTPWQCLHGPFDEEQFSKLPEKDWTLLVQACNHHVPDLALLMESFNFIPSWRIDDVMVSYAPEGGSVGPHNDNYDVFLLQGMGTRRWHISDQAEQKNEYLANTELKILKHFNVEHTWDLQAGDMLYLPPGVAHHGVALDDCMTFSIGFRAPNYAQLMTALFDSVLDDQNNQLEQHFYNDPDLSIQSHNGEITSTAYNKIKSIVEKQVAEKLTSKVWFGQYITELFRGDFSQPLEPELTSDQIQTKLVKGELLVRNECCRVAFMQDNNQVIRFFHNGECDAYPSSMLDIISTISNKRKLRLVDIKSQFNNVAAMQLLCKLVNLGHIEFYDA